ncbi:MAG: acyl-CoA dehydrogenase family protein, partial [Anaerolineales bacterium]
MDFSLTEPQQHIQFLAREFAQGEVAPLAREMDERGEMPLDLVRRMGAMGLLGGPLPGAYGGGDWGTVSLALAYEELGRVDSSVRGLMTVHTSLVAQCILLWGTDEQKRVYLPKLARGEWIGCYCLTEPNAGSDAASIETTASADGDDYVLHGEKIW